MFCESHRRPLMDAATTGEVLPEALAAHLRACESCSGAFAAEQVLFAAIEGSLKIRANAEVPASLIPRVRAAIPENTSPVKPFRSNQMLVPACVAAALAALMLVAFLIPRFKSSMEGGRRGTGAIAGAERVAASSGDAVPKAKGDHPQFPAPHTGFKKIRGTSVLLARSEAKVEPATEVAIRQLIRMTHDQPSVAESLSAGAAADSIVIEPINVSEIAWAPLSPDSDTQNRFEPKQ
jgi:hypothetical protein